MHTAKSLKAKKTHVLFFIQQRKLKKNYYFSIHFGFNNQFIKVMRTWPIFQKIKKNILFCFNVWDYEFIRKTYSRY
jgi:hypothetical protein